MLRFFFPFLFNPKYKVGDKLINPSVGAIVITGVNKKFYRYYYDIGEGSPKTNQYNNVWYIDNEYYLFDEFQDELEESV